MISLSLMLAMAPSVALSLSTQQSTVLSSLDGTWSVFNASMRPIPATVPGTVPAALWRASGAAPADAPTFGYNQRRVLDYSTAGNFTFSRTFATPVGCAASASAAAGRRCEIVFDGIDTTATVTLNGKELGKTENMHLRYVFDATALLAQPTGAANTLRVNIMSATQAGLATAIASGDPECKKHTRNYWPTKFGHNTSCSCYVRKNTGSFGWDCAPAFVQQGIWKSVWLRSFAPSPALIDYVVPVIRGAVNTSGGNGSDGDDGDGNSNSFFEVEVRVRLALDVDAAAATSTASLAVPPPSATVVAQGSWGGAGSRASRSFVLQPAANTSGMEVTLVLNATSPPLWWPAGEGKPILHELTTTLTVGGDAAVTAAAAPATPEGNEGVVSRQRIGFRTFEFVGSVGNNTEKHNGLAPLWFRVNGRPVYAKGQNWMPAEVLVTDDAEDAAMKAQRLGDLAAIGANTIRIWGGGIYETEAFYAAADRLGLMVMQDGSMFGNYPQYPEFLDLVAAEAAHNARRLAAHPSLVVVSGNNENNVFGNIPLFVGAELATHARENPNAKVYPACPSAGWESLDPLVPRQCTTCPHDTHYYGPCGTIPEGVMFGSEFGWPSADIFDVNDAVSPPGANDGFNFTRGSSPFLEYRSQIKNPDWTEESMLLPQSTLTRAFPSLIDSPARSNFTCQFRDGLDWGSTTSNDTGIAIAASSQGECCAICAAAPGCYAATWNPHARGGTAALCWTKTAADASGGQHPKAGVTSCRPVAAPTPAPGRAAATAAQGLERWLYLTQALQAKCVGGSVQAYRQRAEVMGSVNWAVNSIWTGPAWGSVSHDGSWKVLHYRLRHLFTPALLSFIAPVPDALLLRSDRDRGRGRVAASPPPANSSCAVGWVCLHLSNHRHSAIENASCSLHVRGYSDAAGAAPRLTVPFAASAGPVAGADVFSIRLADLLERAGGCGGIDADGPDCFLAAQCTHTSSAGSSTLAAQPYFPAPLARASLQPARLQLQVGAVASATAAAGGGGANKLSVVVEANTTAPEVFLSSGAVPGVFSDNALMLLPGQRASLTFEARAEGQIDVAAFKRGLKAYCMNNLRPSTLAEDVW